jgi:hypothetical protein
MAHLACEQGKPMTKELNPDSARRAGNRRESYPVAGMTLARQTQSQRLPSALLESSNVQLWKKYSESRLRQFASAR